MLLFHMYFYLGLVAKFLITHSTIRFFYTCHFKRGWHQNYFPHVAQENAHFHMFLQLGLFTKMFIKSIIIDSFFFICLFKWNWFRKTCINAAQAHASFVYVYLSSTIECLLFTT